MLRGLYLSFSVKKKTPDNRASYSVMIRNSHIQIPHCEDAEKTRSSTS